uniref:Uncharacterized protein n=1 Tax=Rhizophora mucronata TaxID=61149 RepID=A0A2P2KDA8_RHIMU
MHSHQELCICSVHLCRAVDYPTQRVPRAVRNCFTIYGILV